VTFERWLRGVLERPRAMEDGVVLSTVHRVKGMEWDRVVVYGVTNGILPHRLAEDVEEERRVLHVAITRGRHRVAVLADASRPSPFLDELAGTAKTAAVAALPPTPAAPKAKAGPTPEEEPLRAWRSARARADGVPAYVVLNDETLRLLVEARPTSEAGLRRIKGIGPAKVEKYGDEILEVLGTVT
jgi:DNA helicase-2/ATP-dependent DNA helicase PcrA